MATIKECPVFYSFFNIKKEIKFSEYFQKTCKKPLFKQNFSLIKVNFRQLWLKKLPKWQNFAQSGHPDRAVQK